MYTCSSGMFCLLGQACFLFIYMYEIMADFFCIVQELMVNQDRYALFRPTTDQEGKMIHAEWASLPNVHLDVG